MFSVKSDNPIWRIDLKKQMHVHSFSPNHDLSWYRKSRCLKIHVRENQNDEDRLVQFGTTKRDKQAQVFSQTQFQVIYWIQDLDHPLGESTLEESNRRENDFCKNAYLHIWNYSDLSWYILPLFEHRYWGAIKFEKERIIEDSNCSNTLIIFWKSIWGK